MQLTKDLEREEQNMLLLRHPYLTVKQSAGHMCEFKKDKYKKLKFLWQEEKNEKFNRRVTIMDRSIGSFKSNRRLGLIFILLILQQFIVSLKINIFSLYVNNIY